MAIDHLIAGIIGVNPDRVRYLVEARRRGIGTTNCRTIGISLGELGGKFRTILPRWYNLYGLFTKRHENC